MNAGMKSITSGVLSILGLGAASILGYSIHARATQTGKERLLEEEYVFSPPKFTDHTKLDHGCSEKIFREDPDFDNAKLYGCGVAGIELWDSGTQFSDKTVDYLIFNSEISMRKGNDGWKINTKFDNKSGTAAEYFHYITTYKKENGKSWEEKDTFLIVADTDHVMNRGDEKGEIEVDRGKDNKKYEILLGLRDLNIKIPSESWYKSGNYMLSYLPEGQNDNPEDIKREGLNESHKDKKSWSGIWVEDGRDESSWIFKDLEIFIEDKKYSKVFCKNNSGQSDGCWQVIESSQDNTRLYIKGTKVTEIGETGTWRLIGNTYNTEKEKDNNKVEAKVKPIIDAIQDSKGKWVDTKDFCKLGDETEISEEDWKNLKIFCAAKQH